MNNRSWNFLGDLLWGTASAMLIVAIVLSGVVLGVLGYHFLLGQ